MRIRRIRSRAERIRRRREALSRWSWHHTLYFASLAAFVSIPVLAFAHSLEAGASCVGVLASGLAFTYSDQALRSRGDVVEGAAR